MKSKGKPYWQIQCKSGMYGKWIIWDTFDRIECARKSFQSQFYHADKRCRLVRCEIEKGGEAIG